MSQIESTIVGQILGRESAEVAKRGGTVIALVGDNALFHLENDRWPQAVDVKKVAQYANVFTELAFQFTTS